MILLMAVLFAVTVLTAVILLNTLHAPATVNSQVQSSSLDDIEQVENQVADDMERLFLVHTSMNRTGEALPYVDGTGPDDSFDAVVRNYSELNAALIGSQSGTSVRVTYLDDESREGILVSQNDSTQNLTYKGYDNADQNWTVLENAEELPRFVMNVTEEPDDSKSPFEVVVNDNKKLTFNKTGVEGSGVYCEGYPISVDATDGVGTVSNQSGVCGTFDFDLPDTFDLTFENGSEVTGTYTVSGGNADSDLATEPTDLRAGQQVRDGTDVIVDPKFRLQYTNPTITHSSNFTLYNETQS